GVDQHVVLAPLYGQGTGQAVQAELGHAVVGLAEVAVDAGGGGGEDDPAVLLLAQVFPGGAGNLVGTLDVDLVDQVPVGVLHLVERLVAQDAGFVHDHVDAAEAVQRALHDLATVGHRVMVGHGFATGGADLGGHLVRGRGIGTFA